MDKRQSQTTPHIDADLTQHLAQQDSLLAQVHHTMAKILCEAALNEVAETLPSPGEAEYQLQSDPYDQSLSLYGEWRNPQGQKTGSVLIHQGGQVFAEWDVLCPLPADSSQFVEAVSVWGKEARLGGELRLLDAIS